jgi:hypothetical protein
MKWKSLTPRRRLPERRGVRIRNPIFSEIIGEYLKGVPGMKRRIAIWASVGFVVAVGWIFYSFLAPPQELNLVMREPAVKALAYLTCPVAFAVRNFPLSFWLFAAINAATYGMIGLIVEMLRRKTNLGWQSRGIW